jgi:hypothetical protein
MVSPPDAASIVQRCPALMRRTGFARFDFDIASSDQRYRINIEPGQVTICPKDFSDRNPDFTISAPSPAWMKFAGLTPPPGYHDIVALIECGHAQIEGDTLPFFRHLFLVKGVVAAIFRGDVE